MDMQEKIKEYRKKYSKTLRPWNGTLLTEWEYRLLLDLGAITKNAIRRDYPVLLISEKGDTKTHDFGGDINTIQQKADEINRQSRGISAKMEYTAKTYSDYLEAREQMRDMNYKKEFAEQINTPPPESYEQDTDNFANIHF